MAEFTPFTIAYGDGIVPEIIKVVLYVLCKAEARIRLEIIEVGEKLYKQYYTSGLSEESWESIQRTGIILKAPITTPQGRGYKSLNVTCRQTLQLFTNIRPSVSFHHFTRILHPNLNLTIISENEEDESVKLISHTGCEKIIRYAFEYVIKITVKRYLFKQRSHEIF